MKLTEKQKLLKRLKSFQGMIGDEIQSLEPDFVARLEDVVQRLGLPTKVAIAGLSDSQHRGLAEFLLGDTLFRSAEERDKCPTIQVRYGKEPKTHAIFGETRKTYPGLALSLALGGKKPDVIGIETPNPIAAEIGLMILPAYDGDDNKAGYLINLLDDTEVIIWCSRADAPWQPKERRLWFTVPDPLKERSILAATAAENLTSSEAKQTLEEKREFVSGEFCHLTPMAIDVAIASSSGGTISDPAQFTASGGEELLKQLKELVRNGEADLLEKARQVRAETDEIPLGTGQPVPVEPIPASATTATEPEPIKSPEDQIRATLLTAMRRCKAAVGECSPGDFTALFDPMLDALTELGKAVRGDLELTRDRELVTAQVDEAAELVGLLSYENNEKAAREAADIIRQIAIDIWSRVPDASSGNPQSLTEKIPAAS